MFLFDGPGQHHDFASTLRNECKAPLRRADVGHLPKHPAKPPYLDPQTRAMRFVDEPCSECPGQEQVSRHVSGPRSEEHTSELQSHHDLVCRLLLEKKK